MGGMHNMFGDLISNTMAEEPQARALASMMLSASLTCTQELASYIDETMLQLTKRTGYTEQKAFSLVTQVVRRFFLDLQKVRAQVYASMNVDDATRVCGWMLYGALKTHDIMDEYLRARFRNHPSVSSEYIKFMSTNSGFELVKGIQEKVDELTKQYSQSTKDVLAAKKAADTANGTVDSLKKEINELKRLMAKKADK
ncbi:hypothetical protein ACA910_009043 [Epithemia clementina (nom. ined.)]